MARQKGFAAFYIAILTLGAVFALSVSIFVLSWNQQRLAKDIIKSSQAYYAAEAGPEDAAYRIKNSMNIPAAYTIQVGAGAVDVSIEEPSQGVRVIKANGNKGGIFRKLETNMSIQDIEPEFFYGAQAGTLGIVMENNARIEGTGGQSGNVYSNGPIDGAAGAVITGNVFVATGMSEDQTHTVYNSDQVFGQANPLIDIAQSFQPSVTDNLVKVSIYIKKVGNPDNKTVRILTDTAGSPSQTVLATGTLQKNLVGTSFGWVDVVFPSPPVLAQGISYWLMIDTSQDNNDYWVWGKDQNQGYGNGQAKYSPNWSAGSPVWTEIAGDLDLKTFMGGQATFLKDVTVSGDAHANTITNAKVCGDAYYQTIDANSLNFLNDPSNPDCPDSLSPGTAYPASPDPPLQNMPISDSNINQWKSEALTGGVYTGDLIVSSDMSYGPKKIDGNLVMTSNNKTLTVTGTIYVTGSLDISNGSSIQCSAAYGLNSCVIVIDNWVHISNNGTFQGSGGEGSYLMILSTSPCDGTPGGTCTHYDAAMDLHNNATGAIFYANDGLIYLHNGVEVTELTAKKIHLENNATIRYEQGLINAGFSAGPGGSWQIDSWREIE